MMSDPGCRGETPDVIEAAGKVLSLDGDYAVVEISEKGCGRCDEPGGCGGVHLNQALGSTPRTFRVLNRRGARIGEGVIVVIAADALRRGALLGYGLPVVCVFVGSGLGYWASGNYGSIAGAVVGLFVSWAVMRFSGLARTSADLQPEIK
jgi:sigma-E factor negative regulatory protein RseC